MTFLKPSDVGIRRSLFHELERIGKSIFLDSNSLKTFFSKSKNCLSQKYSSRMDLNRIGLLPCENIWRENFSNNWTGSSNVLLVELLLTSCSRIKKCKVYPEPDELLHLLSGETLQNIWKNSKMGYRHVICNGISHVVPTKISRNIKRYSHTRKN